MSNLKNYVDKLAKTNLNILINGQTGSGKEMLVNYIKRKARVSKVVSVNCAAIPKDLAESILFGHKKGSFTGAVSDQIGKIQEADGGILFLDEIGELDLEIQAKLLRALQESKITPIGGKEVSVNIWPICATHRNLEEMIKNKEFREDLYFRINEAKVYLPTLRERSSDIPKLSAHFLSETISANKLPEKILSEQLLIYLTSREWKGNIRELKTYIRKIALLTEAKIIGLESVRMFDQEIESHISNSYPDDLQEAKKQFVTSHIEKILERCEGNKSKAARMMGITTRNLYRLLPQQNHDNLDIGY